MMLKPQPKLLVLAVALLLGGCTTTQRGLRYQNPAGEDPAATREVTGKSDASVKESAASPGPSAATEKESEVRKDQATDKSEMARNVVTAVGAILMVAAVAVLIVTAVAIGHAAH